MSQRNDFCQDDGIPLMAHHLECCVTHYTLHCTLHLLKLQAVIVSVAAIQGSHILGCLLSY